MLASDSDSDAATFLPIFQQLSPHAAAAMHLQSMLSILRRMVWTETTASLARPLLHLAQLEGGFLAELSTTQFRISTETSGSAVFHFPYQLCSLPNGEQQRR